MSKKTSQQQPIVVVCAEPPPRNATAREFSEHLKRLRRAAELGRALASMAGEEER